MSVNRPYSLRRSSRSNSPHRSPLVRRKLREAAAADEDVFDTVNVATYNDSPEHLYGLEPVDKELEDYLRQEKQIPHQKQQNQNVIGCNKSGPSLSNIISRNLKRDVVKRALKFIVVAAFIYLLYKNLITLVASQTFFTIFLGVVGNKTSHEHVKEHSVRTIDVDGSMERCFDGINKHDEVIKMMQNQLKSFFDLKQQWENEMEMFKSEQNKQRILVESFQQQLLLTVQAVKSLTDKMGGFEKKIYEYETRRNKDTSEHSSGLCKGSDCNLSAMDMHSVVHSTLEIHSADDIALTDFALESAGGKIYSPHHSETCDKGTPIIKVFGLPLWEDPRSPRAIIQPDVLPNHCWSMKGDSGFIVIKLSNQINPTMISLQHLDKRLDQYSKEVFEKAPKEFEVYAWLDGKGSLRIKMGHFTYERNGPSIQTFKLKVKASQPVELVELRILNNYGNPDCTCIYRFRVHGISYDWNTADN